MPDNGEHRPGPQNRHGGAPRGGRFPRWKRWASKARRPRAGHGTHYRVLAAPGRLSALRHPLIGVANRKSEKRIGRREKEKKDNGEEKKRRRKKMRSWEIRRVGKGARRTTYGIATRSIACAVPTRSALSRPRNRVGTARESAPLPTLHSPRYRRACVSTLSVTGLPARTSSSPRRSAGTRLAGPSTFSPRPPQVSTTFS